MKCQKCGAENINEAVKCGICGARLKHNVIRDDFTGSQHVSSSVRRENKKPKTFNPNPNIAPTQRPSLNQDQSLVDKIFDKNTKIEDKARILLDSWQEKAKATLENIQNQPKRKERKNNKWVFIVIAIFIFASPLLGVITRVIIPEIQYQIREHLRIARENNAEAENVPTDEAVAVATEAPAMTNAEYEQRYAEMRSYQQNVERFFRNKYTLPEDLTEIEKFDDVQFSDSIHHAIEVNNGVIIGKFDANPNQIIYLKPEIENKKIIGWSCSKMGIEDDVLSECK